MGGKITKFMSTTLLFVSVMAVLSATLRGCVIDLSFSLFTSLSVLNLGVFRKLDCWCWLLYVKGILHRKKHCHHFLFICHYIPCAMKSTGNFQSL